MYFLPVLDWLICCSEDPDVKGTETSFQRTSTLNLLCCSEDPDVKGTETYFCLNPSTSVASCSEDPDVKGTETLAPSQTKDKQ